MKIAGSYSVFLATILLAGYATAQPAATTPPAAKAPDLKGATFSWLILNNRNKGYTTKIEVDGKPLITFEQGGGVKSQPLTFKDGKNRIDITFTPMPQPNRGAPSASLELLLGSKMLPEPDSALSLGEFSTEEGYEEITINLTFAQNRPAKIELTQQRWSAVDRKVLLWKVSADGDPFADHFAHWTEAEFTAEGNPLSESREENGRLITARDLTPDGKVGAEVAKGNGFRRTFFPDGAVETETPYSDGLIHGEQKEFQSPGKIGITQQFIAGKATGAYKEFDAKERLSISGTFKDDEKDGTWIRYGPRGKEISRSEFKAGKLIKGQDDFE